MTRYRGWIDCSTFALGDLMALLPRSVTVIGSERHPLGTACGTVRLVVLHDVAEWDLKVLEVRVSVTPFSKLVELEPAAKAGPLKV